MEQQNTDGAPAKKGSRAIQILRNSISSSKYLLSNAETRRENLIKKLGLASEEVHKYKEEVINIKKAIELLEIEE